MTEQKTQTGLTDLARQMQALFSYNGSVLAPFDQIMRMQGAMFDRTGTFARHWLDRRHEAAESAIEAAREIGSADRTDPMTAMRVIGEWQRGSFKRLSADMQDWMTLCAEVAQEAAPAQSEPAKAGGDRETKAGTRGRAASSATRPKHTTPV